MISRITLVMHRDSLSMLPLSDSSMKQFEVTPLRSAVHKKHLSANGYCIALAVNLILLYLQLCIIKKLNSVYTKVSGSNFEEEMLLAEVTFNNHKYFDAENCRNNFANNLSY
jgi:hypothetical protein